MNFLKKCLVLKIAVCSLLVADVQAKNVPLAEDAYFAQAPQELLDAVQKAADLTQFAGDYEVRTPKKPSIETYPIYAFAAKNVNILTNTPIIIVNPAWFSTLPADEQEFLLSRYFVTFKTGTTPTGNTMLLIGYCILSLLLFALTFLALRKSRLADVSVWIRILISLVIGIAAELIVFDSIYARLTSHCSIQHEKEIIQKTIEYTGNKDAAIRALEHFDASLKEAIKNGEDSLAPYEHVFANLAREAKSN